ncbi:MAG: M24 family metallopeptidase [Thermoplasmata archaeon]|nr:MAG: M24 family metallopeptidase [Thermoplasmata archaeon]
MKKMVPIIVMFILITLSLGDMVQIYARADSNYDSELDIVKNQFLLQSAEISDIGMQAAKDTLLRAFFENITEADVVRAINDAMTENGSSEYVEAFGVIVASGEQSALPHGDTSDDETNQILLGEVVVVDLGARYRGYCTDLTRTFFIGNATEEMMEIYNITMEAQEAAFEAVSAGAIGSEVDKAARDVISDYGYGENFIHGLGHGIGLYIHMYPLLDPSSNHILFESGDMALTIEPGIYLEEKFGVRIEDDVFVLRTDHEMLTFFPKGIEEAILIPENLTNKTDDIESKSEDEDQSGNYLAALGILIVLVAIGIIVYRSRKRK